MIFQTHSEASFVDPFRKNRLSSRYWLKNLSDEYPYHLLCNEFFRVCPIMIEVSKSTGYDAYFDWQRRQEIKEWCSEHTSGYWMDSNFPERLNIPAISFMKTVISFERDVDAIMFKLRFI